MRAHLLGTLLGGFLLLLTGFSASALEDGVPDSATRFVAADQAYMERSDPERALYAKDRYEEFYLADPGDQDVAWRLATACYFVGDRLAPNKLEREMLFARGRDVAGKAAREHPKCAPCHLLAGINMALYGESVGIVKMLFTLRPIRRYLQRSLELDPDFEGGAAARILATIEQTVPFLLGGSKKRAESYYQRALEIDAKEPLNYFYFARFLDRKKKDPRRALEVALRGLEEPRPEEHRLESQNAWDRLQTLVPALRERIKRPRSKWRPSFFGRGAKDR